MHASSSIQQRLAYSEPLSGHVYHYYYYSNSISFSPRPLKLFSYLWFWGLHHCLPEQMLLTRSHLSANYCDEVCFLCLSSSFEYPCQSVLRSLTFGLLALSLMRCCDLAGQMYIIGWCNREKRKTASDCLAELCEEAVTSSYWKRDCRKGCVECSEISEVLALVW